MVRTRVATIDWLALGTLVSRFRMKWIPDRCHDAAGQHCGDRLAEPFVAVADHVLHARQASGHEGPQKASQPAPSSLVIRSKPSTSQLPLLFTPMATTTTLGVLAGGDDELCGDVGASAALGDDARCCDLEHAEQIAIVCSDLASQREPAAGGCAQGPLGRRRGVELAGGTPTARPQRPLTGVERSELVADRVRRGEDQVRDLVAGLGAHLHRGAAHDVHGTDRLDDPDRVLGVTVCFAGEHGAGGGFGVGRVGRPAPPL